MTQSPLTQPTTDHALEKAEETKEIATPTAEPKLEAPAPTLALNRPSSETQQVKKDYALVTGASSGIGEAFARLLASKKKPLVLMGRNDLKLKSLAEELRNKEGIDVRFLTLDLARSKELPNLPGKLQSMGIKVDILINNAGFGKYGDDQEIRYEDDLNMVNLNCRAVLAMTKLFLPDMLKRRKGAVINIASTAGFAPWPKMATYAATKAFVISYSQSLSQELEGKGVKVLCACPGAVATEFQKRAGMPISPDDRRRYSDPQTVAEQTLEALKSGKDLVIVGRSQAWTRLALNLLPRPLYEKFGP